MNTSAIVQILIVTTGLLYLCMGLKKLKEIMKIMKAVKPLAPCGPFSLSLSDVWRLRAWARQPAGRAPPSWVKGDHRKVAKRLQFGAMFLAKPREDSNKIQVRIYFVNLPKRNIFLYITWVNTFHVKQPLRILILLPLKNNFILTSVFIQISTNSRLGQL